MLEISQREPATSYRQENGWMENQLTPEEQRAWLACEVLLRAAPVPEPPANFTLKTLQRLAQARRRQHLRMLLGGGLLALVVLFLELLVLGTGFLDCNRTIAVLLASRDVWLLPLLRIAVGVIATIRAWAPLALSLAGVCLFFLMPNGILATLTMIVVGCRRQRNF